MPALQHRITAADILSDAEYNARRAELRAASIADKKNRRIEVGPYATLYFENYNSMWLQVQEMLRIEKGGADQIAGELEAYNPLIPQGDELIATFMIEIEDADRRDRELRKLGKIEDSVFMDIGKDRIKAAPTDPESYLDDPEATARMFRDVWFYPGDLGILHAPGRLEVIGREDDLLNIGGRKILPEELEDRIRERAAVGDVGVCALPNTDGIDEVWVAVVYDAPDDRDIRIRLRPAFVDFIYGHAHLVKLAAVPRTATGKIKRADLRAAILAAGKSGR